MSDETKLKILMDAYVAMIRIKAQEPGEASHMLAYHTEFLKREIKIILKSSQKKE